MTREFMKCHSFGVYRKSLCFGQQSLDIIAFLEMVLNHQDGQCGIEVTSYIFVNERTGTDPSPDSSHPLLKLLVCFLNYDCFPSLPHRQQAEYPRQELIENTAPM